MLEHIDYPAFAPLPELLPLDPPRAAEHVRPMPGLSVVVPTRNEQDNITPLIRRLNALPLDVPTEIIFVDDSTDATPDVINASETATQSDLVLIHREAEQRVGGLGGAVIEGIRAARSPWVLVMDADLQHPPELIPDMLAEAARSSADVVIASRYRDQGDAGSFGRARATLSRGSTVSAQVLFPHRLRGVTDPMSGFFLIRRSAVDPDRLKPDGFKILLEILGRTPGLRVREVPFIFGTRHAGESKASLYEGVRFFRLLLRLRLTDSVMRFARFGLVGISGLIINSLLLAFNTELLGLFYVVAALIATQGSTLWNFSLTEWWVFPQHRSAMHPVQRAAVFFAMNNLALAARVPIMYTLTSVLSVHYLISNIISLVALMTLRYLTADRLIWGDGLPSLPSSSPVPASLARPIDQ